jgi:hypothetical protein
MIRRAQDIALKNHCRLASECADPRFAFRHDLCSIVLTVNSGYE